MIPARAEPAFIGLGANLGRPDSALDSAIAAIDRLPATRGAGRSPRYRSAPVDAPPPDYLNQVVRIDTGLAPDALLDALQAIEAAAGRQRDGRNAPRVLDLDLLLYGNPLVSRQGTRLQLPHPRLHERLFVLMPLADLAPALVLPDGVTVAQRLADLLVSSAALDQRCEPALPSDRGLPYSAPPP